MRILQVINSVAPSRGGPTYVVKHLSRALADLGAEVHVLATRADLDEAGEAEVRQTLGDVRLTLLPTIGPARLELSPGWLRALTHAARECDIAHIHTVFTYPVAVAPPLLRMLGVPHVIRPAGTLDSACIAMRSTKQKRMAIAAYVRRNLVGAARVHATSTFEEAELRALMPHARTALLGLGVVVPEQSPPLSQGPPVVGSLGRVHPIKRLEVLIDALPRLPGVSLELAGDGEPLYLAALRARASACGVADRFHLLGHLRDADKRAFLARCHVLAFPSLHESFGIAVAESVAAGRPVVVSPEVGIAQAIADSGSGRVAEPQRFHEALAEILSDARPYAARAHQLARSRWSWDAVARQTLDLYRSANRAATG